LVLVGLTLAFSQCPPMPPPPKQGIIAIVFSDLTGSLNDEIATREKQNIEKLFQQLPVESKFFLFSIDQGTSKPAIYEFAPDFIEIKVASDEEKLERQKHQKQTEKQGIESTKLINALDSYRTSIVRQKGAVSCIASKVNSLVDTVENKARSYSNYEIRIFFYSDMIEECDNSFDGRAATFKRHQNDKEEERHLQDLFDRIDRNIQQAVPPRDLKSMGAKVYVVLTSQDDKQMLTILKKIWNKLFAKLGLAPQDIIWASDTEDYFTRMGSPGTLGLSPKN
jgi:hypothetical protein